MECPWKNLEVEVDSTDGAWYQGSVKNITEDGILVSFKEDLKPDLHVKFENVRLPSKQETENKACYRQGEIIQVNSKTNDKELDRWCKAKIILCKEDLYYVEYLDSDGKDLVQYGQLRHPNLNDSFKKFTAKVPQHLKEICEEDGVHDDVIKHSGVLAVIYSQQQSALIFVSANETIHKKANMLADIHVKTLHQKKQWKQKNERYTETFIVSSDLAGLAIGSHGSNIRKAEKIPGISSVNKISCGDGGYRFYVHSETKEAVKKARSILEFCKETFKVPSQFAGVIIGKNGKNIDDIMNKSLVNRIIKVDQADGVSLDIIGTPETIENAKLLLNFKLNELQEEELMIRKVHNDERFDPENIQHNRGHRSRRGWRDRGGRSRRGTAKKSTSLHDLHRTPLKQNSDDDQNAQPIEKENNLNKSYQNFNALFQDAVEDEDIDKIYEIEVLKYLVQTFNGGCSFGEFVCYAAGELFAECDIKDWLSARGRKFHIYRNGSEIVYIAPFYRELNICKHFFNPSKLSCCKNPNCNYFHICRNFVRGNCRRRDCSLPHNFTSSENEKLKEKYKLEDFNDSDIIVLLNWKFGRLCHDYIYKDDCQEEECPYLHYCKNFFFNKCDMGDNCKFNHSFGDTHNKWVLRSCHLSNQSDDSLRRLVYVPPIPRGMNTRKDSTHNAEVEDHSDEENFTTALSSDRKQSNVTKNLMAYDPLKSSWQATSYTDFMGYDPLRSSWQATPNTDYMSATSQSSSMACDKLGLIPKSRPVKSQTNQCWNASYLSSISSQNTEFPKTYRQVGFQNILGMNPSQVNEVLPESDALLLSENAMEKHICISLTKRDCPSPACQDLHVQYGVPFLWQIKLHGHWVSFLPKDNFHIEQAYCILNEVVCVQDLVYNGEICSVDVHFTMQSKGMYGIVDIGKASMIYRAIRRLSTPSFGDKPLSVDSYVTQWRWYWKDNDDAWVIYDSNLQIYTLEVKFLKQQKTYLFSRDNYRLKYRLCFTSMEQVNIEYGTRREILRRPIFVSENDLQTRKYPEKIASTAIEIFGEDSKPVHFHPWDLANEFELVELESTSGGEYTEVLSSFHKTMRQGKYDVDSIYRVQNRKLWSQYQTKKKHMHADAEKDNPSGSSIDERSLFHGTDTLDICRGICINNFDFRKSGKNATVYGQGSYFARDARYSHHYTKASESDERYMFRAKVLVGKFTQGRSDYRRPPEIPGESHKLYDACVDSPIDPSIFVVFDRSQTYPEYLIKYTVKTENVVSTSYGVSSPSTTSYMHQPVSSSNPGLSSRSQSAFNSLNSSRNTNATNFVGGAAPSVTTQKPASSSSYSSGSPSSINSFNSSRNTSATNFVGGVAPSVTTQKPISSSSNSSGSPSSINSLNSIRNTNATNFVGGAAPSVTTQKPASSSSNSSGSPSSINSLNSIRNTNATNFVGGAAPSITTQKPASSSSYSSGSPSNFNSLNSNRNTNATHFVSGATPSVTTQKPASSSSYSSGGNSGSRGFHQSTQSSSEYWPPSKPTRKKSSRDCAIL